VIFLAAAPIAVGLLACLLSGRIGRLLQPRRAVPLLTGLALTIALCTGIALSALAVLTFAQFGPISRIGHWSGPVLRHRSDFPDGLGLAAFVVVVACFGAALLRAAASTRTLICASRTARGMHPVHGDLVLVDDDEPTAYAVAGWHGRIVVSTAMLAALPADERRVLLAHEAAHVQHRHHVYVHLAALAAAANPLLRSTQAAIKLGVERWADEVAAGEVGDRQTAARGLARAALIQTRRARPFGQLAAAETAVAERVRALLKPAPTSRRLTSAVVLAGVAACWIAAAVATWRTHELIQAAESAVTNH
jgi:Zn-dependent protease with chaperone function